MTEQNANLSMWQADSAAGEAKTLDRICPMEPVMLTLG